MLGFGRAAVGGRPPIGPNKKERLREAARAAREADGSSLREKALAFVRERGVVRTMDLEAIGVPRQYPRMMYEDGLLVRVRYGRYRIPDVVA